MGIFTHKLKIELEEIRHKHRLELTERQADFDREKKVWEEDRERLTISLTKEHELKLKEVVTLTKLDSEQKSKQMELNFQRKISELESKNIRDMADLKAKLTEEHYTKLTAAMTKLHEEGNTATRFTQELALKMFANAPKNKTQHKLITKNVNGTDPQK